MALSAHAANMSDWIFMGLPAAVYLQGRIQIWISSGLLSECFALGIIAARLRIASEKYGGLTVASYF